ncbi:MAG: AraC family transcriptional regulator [Clostridia bacterium]|nr:AraC family transcriptional regulator [Clostridia bacterium]
MYENATYCGAGKFVSHGEWIHPDRVIDSHEIIFVIKGRVYLTEDGKEYELKENDVLLLEQGLRHYGHFPSSNTSFFWVHFKNAPKPDPALKLRNMKDSYDLPLLFKQLVHYRAENRPTEAMDYLTRLILIECFSPQVSDVRSPTVSEIAAWINANRDTVIKAEQVAAHFGYNADYLSRAFKASCGKPLKEYIDSVKMTYIKQLLLTGGKTLTDVSCEAGFSDYKYFLKYFKYHEGITPTQFLSTYPKTHINTK